MVTAGARRGRGDLEREVLAALGAAGAPATPAEVRERLAGDLAYTTVMTTLARLHEKGLVLRERDGRAHRYRVADATEVAAARMRRTLESSERREAVLARFVGDLAPEDVPVLERLLRDAERRG
ncbi:BlaI/MecI/CopY family transcriptional regulator [Quadrisphaera sp. KR29]|uniref:BlaI/MecI/CopY family transcriptional regulator n=1 Tax=Quadrisphaera sp. KR29 TaxID=3461391 RepID=UPI004043AEBD